MVKRYLSHTLVLCSLLILLAACSSTPNVNVSNQFWYGAITQEGSFVSIPAGLGFQQTDEQVVAGFAFAIDSETYGGRLTGTITGNTLTLSDTDAVGDSVLIDGTFDPGVQNFSGTLTFILDGVPARYDLNLAFNSMLTTDLSASTAPKWSVRQLYKQLKLNK
jgi:hypothetical protein